MNLTIPRVILLVVAAALVVIASLAALSRPRTALRLQAFVSMAPGVRVGSTVLFRGIEVGRVSSITFADSGVRLGLELSRGDVPIRSADTIRFATIGLLGDKVVDVRQGPLTAPLLTEGGVLRVEGPAMGVPLVDVDSLVRALKRNGIILGSDRDTSRSAGHRP
jgi:ABC-type transporter Mla subunit MlaD